MVDFVTLENRVWSGEYSGINAYYYADSDKQITVALLDVYGNSVYSTTKNVSAGINTIDIADILYNSGVTINDGYYILQIGDFYITFIVSKNGSVSNFAMGTDYEGKVKKIMVWDTKSGLFTELPPSSTIVPTGQFISFVYAHDDQKKLGKLVIFQGTSSTETDWARYAIIEVSIGFNSVDDLYNYVANYVDATDQYSAQVIGKIANSSKSDAVKIASLYHLYHPLGTILSWSLDLDKLAISMKIAVRLGFGWHDVWRAVKYGLAGAIAGAGVVAGVAIAVGTFGAGAVIGGAVAGAALGVAYSFISSSNDSNWSNRITQTASEGIANVTKATGDALGTLDYYHNLGEVSDEAYNAIKQQIEHIKDVAINAIKELEKEAKDCYQAGYNKCKQKYEKYVIGAGAGGLVLGSLLARR